MSFLLGLLGGLLAGWGISRAGHGHPDGWGFAFLGLVLAFLGITHGLWGT